MNFITIEIARGSNSTQTLFSIELVVYQYWHLILQSALLISPTCNGNSANTQHRLSTASPVFNAPHLLSLHASSFLLCCHLVITLIFPSPYLFVGRDLGPQFLVGFSWYRTIFNLRKLAKCALCEFVPSKSISLLGTVCKIL